MAPKFRPLLLAYALLNHVRNAAALVTNRTIDDQLGDSVTGALPTYVPQNIWVQGYQCKTCFAMPDYQQTFDHTWHDATAAGDRSEEEVNVTMTLTGTAIYAYCIIVNDISYGSFTNLTFSIDGAQVGSYSHSPDSSASTYLYNTLVYANTSIPNGNHTFVIHAQRGVSGSLVLFDYVQYTYTDSTASSVSSESISASLTSASESSPTVTALASTSSSAPTGAIAGGIVAAVVVLGLIAGAIFFLRRRRTRRDSPLDMAEKSTVSSWPQQPARFASGPHSNDGQPVLQHSNVASSRHPLPLVVSNPDSSSSNEGPVPHRTELLHQLEDHQRKLAELQDPSSKQQPRLEKYGSASVQSQVEDLRLEVTRLREMMANSETAPPEYHVD